MRRWLEYLGYRLLAFLVPYLPRRLAVWTGRRLGGLYFLVDPGARRVGLENLRRVFPERTDHARILRESLRLQGVALLDALWWGRRPEARARAYVRIGPEGTALLQEALARGRGVVLATAHFGSWEALNVAAGGLGLPRATFIARPVRNARVDAHLRRARERTGNRLVYRDDAVLACAGALRRGEIVCSVIDMAVLPSEGGVFCEFLGTPATTSAALPLLALRLRAPLLFALCRPLDGGLRYVVEGCEIAATPTGDRDADLLRVARALNAALEAAIRGQPEAWIWSYKRWKFRPSELPGTYPDYALWVHPRW